jgi:hypothetical protein
MAVAVALLMNTLRLTQSQTQAAVVAETMALVVLES